MTTERFVIKGKRHAGTITATSDRIVIGSATACTLTVDDPLVADGHASIAFSGRGFEIEDLETSAGTYVNGIAVRRRSSLANGDTIVLGLSKLLVEIDGSTLQMRLTLKEKGFHFDKKTDPLAWAKAEVGFGRFPALRRGNWIAACLVVVLLGAFFLTAFGEWSADPGPLVAAHADALVSHEKADGCASCHASFGGTPRDRCVVCHEDIARNTHPFGEWKDHQCVPCHIDHRGVANRSTVARVASETCGDCHESDRAIEERLAAEAPTPTRDVEIPYDTFSHKNHVETEGIACARCHVRAEVPTQALASTADGAGRPRKEFAAVSHEICMSCHAADAPDGERAKTTYNSTWHGTEDDGSNCLRCHRTLHEKELREVSSRRIGREYAFLSRSHHEQLVDVESGQPMACERCHRRGTVGGGRELRSVFRHGTHMSALYPPDDAGAAARSDECAACHTEDAKAARLSSNVYRGPDASSCQRCHREDSGEPRAPSLIEVTTGDDVSRVDFPHDAHEGSSHASLERGCFACHEFGDGEAWSARPSTHESAKTCKPCHEKHDSLGGGDCDACHGAEDSVYTRVPSTRSWPVNASFSHFSFGHAEIIEERGRDGCLECHGGAETAETVSSVPIPSEADTLCRDCHVSRKTRFHWR